MQNVIPINTVSCILQILPKYLNFNVLKFKITHSDILWEVEEISIHFTKTKSYLSIVYCIVNY